LAWTQDRLAEQYGRPKRELNDEQNTVSAALSWLLKGHAAQRVIAAWHVGWAPAQQVSGADWLAPFQARLLADPYGVVRYVAHDRLKSLPGFADFHYDFLDSTRQLDERVSAALDIWKAQTNRLSRTGPELLIGPDARIMQAKLEAMLNERDNRPVTIKE
jgi:hypothetical protein